MADETKTLWRKSDEHGKDIQELKLQTALTKKVLSDHTASFSTIQKDIGAHHGELISKVEGIASDVKTVMSDYNQRQGALKAMRWVIPLAIMFFAAVAAYLLV